MNTKLYLLIGAIFLTGAATYLFLHKKPSAEAPVFSDNMYAQFEKFKSTYNKKYGSQEESYRLSVFSDNYNQIQQHNSENKLYQLKVTQFTDLTQQEFKDAILMKELPQPEVIKSEKATPAATPSSVDWRKKGALTPVKDQGQCGSCWSFSTTGVLEGSAALQGKGLQSFAEQQLVDCCGKDGFQCDGCNGAWPTWALDYVKAKGITTEDKYPYKAVEGDCKIDSGDFKVSKYTQIASGDLDGLEQAVAKQPVSICVDASQWSMYGGGVFDSCSDEQGAQDHAVLLVGYTADYWIVKNSWNTSWGEDGFIRLKRGKGLNTCGLALNAVTTQI